MGLRVYLQDSHLSTQESAGSLTCSLLPPAILSTAGLQCLPDRK
jgi:hypothetical protein